MSSDLTLNDLVRCFHCEDIYTDPQLLPCQHTFCRKCVDELQEGELLECPACALTCSLDELQQDFNKEQLVSLFETANVSSVAASESEAHPSEADDVVRSLAAAGDSLSANPTDSHQDIDSEVRRSS